MVIRPALDSTSIILGVFRNRSKIVSRYAMVPNGLPDVELGNHRDSPDTGPNKACGTDVAFVTGAIHPNSVAVNR